MRATLPSGLDKLFSSRPRARATAWRCTRWPSCRARWHPHRARHAAARAGPVRARKTMRTPRQRLPWRCLPLARGFFDWLPAARAAAVQQPAPWDAPPCAAWRCSTASAPTCRKSWCVGPTWWWPTTTTTTTAPPCSTPSRSSRAGAWPCWRTGPQPAGARTHVHRAAVPFELAAARQAATGPVKRNTRRPATASGNALSWASKTVGQAAEDAGAPGAPGVLHAGATSPAPPSPPRPATRPTPPYRPRCWRGAARRGR